jgi:hypothetical protein
MDTGTELVIWLFGIFNAGEVLSHFPQIVVALGCRDGARSISLATWSYFALTYFSGALYFLRAVHDSFLAALFFGNFLACITLICVVIVKRRQAAQSADLPQTDVTSPTMALRIPQRLTLLP